VYFPVCLTTSYAAIPPKNAAIGEITLLENLDWRVIVFLTSSVIPSKLNAPSTVFNLLLIISAVAKTSSESA